MADVEFRVADAKSNYLTLLTLNSRTPSLNQSQCGNCQQEILGKDVQGETYDLKSIESRQISF